MKQRLRTYCFFFFVFFLIEHPLLAQEKKLYSFQMREATFDQIIDSIQSKTGFKIFFDPHKVDTLAQSFIVDLKPIEDLIQTLINNKHLQYYITKQKQIFIFDKSTALMSEQLSKFLLQIQTDKFETSVIIPQQQEVMTKPVAEQSESKLI